jgi:NOL1/NOP2/fmu family ribosome biogenesis protein
VRGEGFFLAVLRKTGDVQSQNLKTNPPKDWQRFPEKQLGIFDGWLAQAADNEFFTKPDGVVMAVPKVASEAFFAVGNVLKKRSLGLEMGELKNKDFIPSHTLALSNGLHPILPKVDLTKDQALLFLKKENIWEKGWPRGCTLASYENLPLGWMKVLDNRINSYLPTSWRIRMDLRV